MAPMSVDEIKRICTENGGDSWTSPEFQINETEKNPDGVCAARSQHFLHLCDEFHMDMLTIGEYMSLPANLKIDMLQREENIYLGKKDHKKMEDLLGRGTFPSGKKVAAYRLAEQAVLAARGDAQIFGEPYNTKTGETNGINNGLKELASRIAGSDTTRCTISLKNIAPKGSGHRIAAAANTTHVIIYDPNLGYFRLPRTNVDGIARVLEGIISRYPGPKHSYPKIYARYHPILSQRHMEKSDANPLAHISYLAKDDAAKFLQHYANDKNKGASGFANRLGFELGQLGLTSLQQGICLAGIINFMSALAKAKEQDPTSVDLPTTEDCEKIITSVAQGVKLKLQELSTPPHTLREDDLHNIAYTSAMFAVADIAVPTLKELTWGKDSKKTKFDSTTLKHHSWRSPPPLMIQELEQYVHTKDHTIVNGMLIAAETNIRQAGGDVGAFHEELLSAVSSLPSSSSSTKVDLNDLSLLIKAIAHTAVENATKETLKK